MEISDDGAQWIELLSTDLPEVYTRFLFDLDASGVPLDGETHVRFRLNSTSLPEVFFDDIRIITGDLVGPRVVAQLPAVVSANAPDAGTVTLQFDKPVVSSSFDLSDVQVHDPMGGAVPVTGVNAAAGMSNMVYEISLAASTIRGRYRIRVGPDVLDESGNAMNEDGDASNGEPEDAYQGTWEFEQTIWSPARGRKRTLR